MRRYRTETLHHVMPCHALILTYNQVQRGNFGGNFSHRDMSSSGKALLLPWHGKACLDAQFEIQHCRLTLELPTFHVAIVESLNDGIYGIT